MGRCRYIIVESGKWKVERAPSPLSPSPPAPPRKRSGGEGGADYGGLPAAGVRKRDSPCGAGGAGTRWSCGESNSGPESWITHVYVRSQSFDLACANANRRGFGAGQPLFSLKRCPVAQQHRTVSLCDALICPGCGRDRRTRSPWGSALLRLLTQRGQERVSARWQLLFCTLLRGRCAPARSELSPLPVETIFSPDYI